MIKMVFKTLDVRQGGNSLERERSRQDEPQDCPSLLQLTFKKIGV